MRAVLDGKRTLSLRFPYAPPPDAMRQQSGRENALLALLITLEGGVG